MPGSSLSLSLVSEHASPLAPVGGTDAGGQNIYVRELARGLGRRGHRVTVYTRRTSADQPASLALASGVRVVHVPAGPPIFVPKEELAPFMGDFGDQLALHWQDDPPDLVHAHYWMSGIAVLRGVRRTAVPVVQTFHALADDRLRFLRETRTRERERERFGIERTVAQMADRVIALTSAESSLISERFGVPPSRVSVVPCGVDLTRFHPEGPGALDGSGAPGAVATASARRSSRRRLLTVGRLVARKGVATVLEALAVLPAAELLVAGGPPASDLPRDAEFGRLRDLADDLGVRSRVRFLGQVPHESIPALLRDADVFATAPWYEPFGMAALEAAACGVPIVTTDVGGLRETVVDGVTGYRVPPASPSELADRLRALLDDPARRSDFGAAAARHAARFSWDRVTDEILAVYDNIIAEMNPSREIHPGNSHVS